MITEDQTAVTEFLGSSSTQGGVPVERIDTHTAVVFLAGTRAWKLKRAVLFDYLDFSTAARRKALCDAEVRLNRHTAPTLYVGVTALTRERDGSPALGWFGKATQPRHPIASTRRSPSARVAVRGGGCAIVDAVYASPGERQVIERVAARASVPFVLQPFLPPTEASYRRRSGSRGSSDWTSSMLTTQEV